MSRSTDYLTNSDNSLMFRGGDLAIGDSDETHVEDTIKAEAGWWKQFPTDGVGITKYLGAKLDALELKANIRKQLRIDGYTTVPSPDVFFDSNGKLNVNPNAKKL